MYVGNQNRVTCVGFYFRGVRQFVYVLTIFSFGERLWMSCTVVLIMCFVMELSVKPEKCFGVAVGCYRLKWTVPVPLADLRYSLDDQVLCLRWHFVGAHRFQYTSDLRQHFEGKPNTSMLLNHVVWRNLMILDYNLVCFMSIFRLQWWL
jgi:hypothetical protein